VLLATRAVCNAREPYITRQGCKSALALLRSFPEECEDVRMAQRLTYRRRHCYATQSNKTRKVKTPGDYGGHLAPVRDLFVKI